MRSKSGRHHGDPEEQPMTHVSSPGGGLVEVGSLHAKRDFTVTEHLLSEIPDHMNFTAGVPTGTMSLVGAGPGDPDLLTMAALKELQKADLVVSDRLVSAEILSLVKCELRVAHKSPGCATQAQREIYRWCFEALMKGKRVVRLKIGDPFVFGRGGEEVAEFRRFGVEPTVVPGISSALAGPMAAMIPVTHRGVANKVAFCTGMDRNEDTPAVPVYDEEQTVVYLMAVGRLRELCEMMVKQGYPEGTPVGIIERATTPQQREVIGTLDEIADLAEQQSVRAPAIVVVGEVVGALGNRDSEGDAVEQSFALEWLADNGLLQLPLLRE
jgi:uroporphyrin-III C-methyltransferase